MHVVIKVTGQGDLQQFLTVLYHLKGKRREKKSKAEPQTEKEQKEKNNYQLPWHFLVFSSPKAPLTEH